MSSPTTNVLKRPTTASKIDEHVFGPAEALAHAWVQCGRPGDFKTFRLGFEAAAKELKQFSVAPAEVVAELEKAGRIIYMQDRQMSPQQRILYARNAHAAGLIGDDATRETERAAVIARATGGERFPKVSCSNCGQACGAGGEGFSHCEDHAHLRAAR